MFTSLGKDFELLTNEVVTLYELYGWLWKEPFFFLLSQLNTGIAALCRPATPLVYAGVLCGAPATQIHVGTCRTVIW